MAALALDERHESTLPPSHRGLPTYQHVSSRMDRLFNNDKNPQRVSIPAFSKQATPLHA